MKNPNFKKRLMRKGYGTVDYEVKNTDGMTDEEIIDACDCNNFGGRVYGNYVTVYID